MEVQRAGKTKEEVVRAFRTEHILDAAERVIADTGLADASVGRIAREAGVAKGTLYLYFKDKETLLLAVFHTLLAELLKSTRAAIHRQRGARTKLREVVRVCLEHGDRHPALLEALAEDSHLAPGAAPELARAVRGRMRSYVRLIAGAIDRGVRSGELRAVDSRWAARFLVEITRVAMLGELHAPHPADREARGDLVVDFFLHGVGKGERG